MFHVASRTVLLDTPASTPCARLTGVIREKACTVDWFWQFEARTGVCSV